MDALFSNTIIPSTYLNCHFDLNSSKKVLQRLKNVLFITKCFIYLILLQDELEKFPLDLVYEPTAIFKDDKREIYNNLILFSVLEDSRKRNGPSDMHIFQSVVNPVSSWASVEDITLCRVW